MIHKTFKSALLWNSLQVILYKIILQTHQLCLFYVVSKVLFGISGTLFSTIYLLISLTNFGFDYSLFQFHRYYTASKNNFLSLLKLFAIRCTTLSIVTATLLAALHHYASMPQILFVMQYVPANLLIVLIGIFISESLKKTLELFAHLSFLNKTITIVEIMTLLSYIAIIWSSYFIRGQIDLYTIFIPMCIMSIVELTIIVFRLKLFYQSLPSLPLHIDDLEKPNNRSILLNQAVNYINQIAKAIFSPNFIIIFIAYHLGMVKAGYIKLIIDIIILLYMLLNRAVGTSSAALMSQASSMQQSLMPDFKTTFIKITNGYIQFLYILACTLAAAIGPCLLKSICLSSTLVANILLFTFAGFLEFIIITYEKLYLTQSQATLLAKINVYSLIFLYLALSYPLPIQLILLPFIIVRLCVVTLLIIKAKKIWHVSPNFHLQKNTALLAAIITICLSFWHYFFI